jgi:hypothetical protein
MELSSLLERIKVDGDLQHLKQLVKDNKVQHVIENVCKRNHCKRNVIEDLLKDYTIRYYKYDDEYTEERFINSIKKYLGRKGREQLKSHGI